MILISTEKRKQSNLFLIQKEAVQFFSSYFLHDQTFSILKCSESLDFLIILSVSF